MCIRFLLRRVWLLILLLCGTAFGQTVRPAERRPSDWERSTTLVNGWEFVKKDLGGVWETMRSSALALDLPVWTPVTLPHSFNHRDAVDPDTPYYQGPAWYRTQLRIENPFPNGRTLLHFEGSGQVTEVYIGEKRVARHVGGYDEYTVDITDAVAAYRQSPLSRLPAETSRIAPGNVPLAVRCDNSRNLETIPSDLSDFNLYGGIYRPVQLVYLPATALGRVHLEPARDSNGAWTVGIKAALQASSGSQVEQDLVARVIAPDGSVAAERRIRAVMTSGMVEIARIAIEHPVLWSPNQPALYGVELTASGPAGQSRVWQRFGLRTSEFVRNGPFKLNGERLLLRGTHRHEDHAGMAAAMSDDLLEREMRMMKEMGVNFIRLGHYQQSRRVLELCDELGLLVWEEIPWCRGGLGGEEYRDQARAMLRAMIDQHYNHPSVFLWGLGNENDWPGDFPTFEKQEIRSFMKELHDLAHQLDPNRVTGIRRCDFCKDIVDVYSPSIWSGWYRGKFTEYAAVTRREVERVPHFLHVEWGGDSHAGRHAEDPYAALRDLTVAGAADERGLDFKNIGGDARASKDGDWSETYICDLVDWHLKEQLKMDWLTGTAMWPFKDFSTPLRPENPVPFVNQKGAVERDLTKKESFYVYQSYWSDQPMLRIYGHSWPVRWGAAGAKRWVKVYSNCEEVELWLNGVSQGRRKRNPEDFPAAGLRWDVPFIEGMNTLRARGVRDGVTVEDQITLRYETRKWGAPRRLRLWQETLSSDRVRIHVELLDEAGVVCLDSALHVRFGHAGDGKLLDNLGVMGGSRYLQLANGRARIDLETAAGGRAVVSAEVKGVATELIEVTSLPSREVAVAGADTLSSAYRQVLELEKKRVVTDATEMLMREPRGLRSIELPSVVKSLGAQPGDFVSMGDYWWPDLSAKDGLPYVRRDGETNPENFVGHRLVLGEMRETVATLASAYLASGDLRYARRAADWLRVFFVDPSTRMNPHLDFAQAIPGVTKGRGIGIIDTLHLCEVALAAGAIVSADEDVKTVVEGTRRWFGEYLHWMRTDPKGIEEANTKNNHSVAYFLQLAVFAGFTEDETLLDEVGRNFLQVLLPEQLAPDGSFPRELSRTKPYGYSIFQLDNVVLLAEVLSRTNTGGAAKTFALDHRLARALDFLFPYLVNPESWPFRRDIEHFEAWPIRQPALLIGGHRLGRPEYLKLWKQLPSSSENLEVRRNMAVTQPLLWIQSWQR